MEWGRADGERYTPNTTSPFPSPSHPIPFHPSLSLLGLPLKEQNALFLHFSDLFDATVRERKQAGQYDGGITDLSRGAEVTLVEGFPEKASGLCGGKRMGMKAM